MSRPLLVLIAACLVLAACENSQEEIDTWTKKAIMQEEALNVTSYMSQEGQMKAKLTAPLMYRNLGSAGLADTQYVEFPRNLHVDFYDSLNKVETMLDAKYGKYFETQNRVYLRDSVVVVTLKGDTLRCHDLWWDQNKGIFYTDTTATYKAPGNNLSGGKGMEATQDLKTVTFKEPLGDLKIGDSGFAQ